MTRAELRALVKSNLGGRIDKDSVINAALEEGLKQSARLHFFRSLSSESDVTIVADEAYIDLPTTTYQLIEARLIDGASSFPITLKTKQWLVDKLPNISEISTGRPTYAYIEGNDLFLYPISDGSYSIRVTVTTKPTFSSADDTENPIPSLDIALVAFATGYVMKSIQMFEYAVPWDQEYLKLFMGAQLGDKKGPEVMQFQPFTSEARKLDEGLSRDNDTDIITGRMIF